MNDDSGSVTQWRLARFVALFFAVLFSILSILGIVALFLARTIDGWPVLVLEMIIAAAGWSVAVHIERAPSRILIVPAFRWAVGIGVPAFVLGYVTPLLFHFGGNLGPLFGVFLTGPVGALVGAVIGVVRALPKYRAARASDANESAAA